MAFLFGGKKASAAPPEFTGFQTQTAVNVLPIPLIYGSPRVSTNIIYVNGFNAVAVKQMTGGGKGLLGGGKGGSGSVTYEYRATLILAVGEGPIGSPLIIFQNQDVYNLGSLPAPLQYFNGAQSEPWGYVTANWPDDARIYPETAYFAGADYPLDSSATISQFNFLVAGLLQGTCPLNRADYVVANSNSPNGATAVALDLDMDADPALVIVDFLTHPEHGAGFPAALIDASIFSTADALNPTIGDATLQTYCQAVGLGFSVSLSGAEAASQILQRWVDLLSVGVVWTGSILKFIPFYNAACFANPGWDSANPADIPLKYFSPNLTPLFSLGDDDFVQSTDNSPPLAYERIDTADVFNTVRMDFKDRYNLWNDNVAEAKNENDIELNGIRVDAVSSAQEFSLAAYAAIAAQLKVNRNTSIRVRYTFKLSWEYCILDPMDIVDINDATLGLVNFPVRIWSIEEDDKSELTIVAEEFQAGSQAALQYPKQPSTSAAFNTNYPPNNVNQPFIFEPTPQLLQYVGQSLPTLVLGITCGPHGAYDPNFGGANIYASLDGTTYSLQGTFTGRSTMGVLTAPLATYSSTNPDNVNTLSLDMTQSHGQLVTMTEDQAANYQGLAAIWDYMGSGAVEYMSVKNFNMTGPYTYDCTGLYRGLFGTTPAAFPAGALFLFLANDSFFQETLPSQFVGQEIDFKLQSFNIFNKEAQELSHCDVYHYTPAGTGSGPGGTGTGYPVYTVRVVTSNTNIAL